MDEYYSDRYDQHGLWSQLDQFEQALNASDQWKDRQDQDLAPAGSILRRARWTLEMLRNLREAQDKRAVPYGSLTTASQTLTPLIGTINTWTQNPAAYPQTMTDADVLMDTLVGELAKWPTFTEEIVPARIAEAEHYVAAI